MSNAFKYTLRGGVAVTLRLADEANAAELIVADTGVGIPADELPRIFDRFHRIAGQRGRTMEGTGIGLALVHELVRLHGGTIDVESRVGVGTTVRVVDAVRTRRICRSNRYRGDCGRATPEASAAARSSPRRCAGCRTGPKTRRDAGMLGAAARWALGRWLARRRGRHGCCWPTTTPICATTSATAARRYDVQVVSDGEAALAAIAPARPDLVLSDVMMPRLDGSACFPRCAPIRCCAICR